MITDEEEKQIKEHLLLQLENFPEEKREMIKEKVLSMTNEQLEDFIKQKGLVPEKNEEKGECIFCKIANKTTPSFILHEDKENVAVLEINPLSKGHALIIPKKHLSREKIPQTTFSIAKKVFFILKKKYKPRDIKINPTTMMNHSLIEIIPIYGNEKERRRASEEELLLVQKDIRIEKKQRNTLIKKEKLKSEEKTKIPIIKPRIP